jgi:hypothetical protein
VLVVVLASHQSRRNPTTIWLRGRAFELALLGVGLTMLHRLRRQFAYVGDGVDRSRAAIVTSLIA